MIMTKFQLKTRSMIIGASKPTFEVVMLEGWTPRSFLMGVWVPGYQQTQENYRKLWGTNQFLADQVLHKRPVASATIIIGF